MTSYNVLGSGGYGFVLDPALPNENETGASITFPNYVTKVFKREEDYDDILVKSILLKDIMGENSGHEIKRYTKEYKKRNIPEFKDRLGGKDDDPLWIVRMPKLGISFNNLTKFNPASGTENVVTLRTVPIITIVEQIIKLITQVKNLWDSGWIHGDIRSENIMINPITGIMTLIDFDWLREIYDFYEEFPLGFYSNPPECLVIDFALKSRRLSFEDRKIPIVMPKMKDYMVKSLEFFEYLQPLFFVGNAANNRKKYEKFYKFLIEVNKENYTYLKENPNRLDPTRSLKTLDSFGLASALLVFFYRCYPGSISKDNFKSDSKEILTETLTPLITNRGMNYTRGELEACIDAIYRMVNEVLFPMASYKIIDRITIDTGLIKATEILATLKTNFSPSTSYTIVDPPPLPSNLSHTGGRKMRRKTRGYRHPIKQGTSRRLHKK